jgi:hypothetical protein
MGIDRHADGMVMIAMARRLLRGTRSATRTFDREGKMDKKISDLFEQWLAAFETMQVASSEAEVAKAHRMLDDIEARMVETPAEGMEGLVVKLGLHCFLNEHADAASAQSDSAYRDLVRLTGQNPAGEIAKRFEQKAA